MSAIDSEQADLDPEIPPARAFAGAWHLVIAATERSRLSRLDCEFDALREVMDGDGLTTIQLVWRPPLLVAT